MSSKQIRVEVPSNSHVTIEGDVDEGEEIIVKAVESKRVDSEMSTPWGWVREKISMANTLVWSYPEHVTTFLNWIAISLAMISGL